MCVSLNNNFIRSRFGVPKKNKGEEEKEMQLVLATRIEGKIYVGDPSLFQRTQNWFYEYRIRL